MPSTKHSKNMDADISIFGEENEDNCFYEEDGDDYEFETVNKCRLEEDDEELEFTSTVIINKFTPSVPTKIAVFCVLQKNEKRSCLVLENLNNKNVSSIFYRDDLRDLEESPIGKTWSKQPTGGSLCNSFDTYENYPVLGYNRPTKNEGFTTVKSKKKNL